MYNPEEILDNYKTSQDYKDALKEARRIVGYGKRAKDRISGKVSRRRVQKRSNSSAGAKGTGQRDTSTAAGVGYSDRENGADAIQEIG